MNWQEELKREQEENERRSKKCKERLEASMIPMAAIGMVIGLFGFFGGLEEWQGLLLTVPFIIGFTVWNIWQMNKV